MTETHLVADVETVNHIRGASFRATSGEEEEEEEEEASEADTWAGKNGLENSRRRFLLPPVVAPSIYDRIFCAAIFFSSSLKIFQRNRGRQSVEELGDCYFRARIDFFFILILLLLHSGEKWLERNFCGRRGRFVFLLVWTNGLWVFMIRMIKVGRFDFGSRILAIIPLSW